MFCIGGFGVRVSPRPAPPPHSHDQVEPVPVLPELTLTRGQGLRLVRGETIRGGLWQPDGRLLVWGSFGLSRIDLQRGKRERLCQGRLDGAAGAGLVQGKLEIADTIRGAVFAVDSSTCKFRYRLPGGGLKSLVATPAGWFALASESLQGVSLVFWPHGDPESLHRSRLPLDLVDTSRRDWVQLAGSAKGLFVLDRLFPFPWVSLDDRGRLLVDRNARGTPLIPALAQQHPSDTLLTWLALPPVHLGLGIVRLVADTEGRRRVLQVFDSLGVLARTRIIDRPIGFFAVDHQTQQLAAVAGWPVQDLISYTWRWSP